MWVRLSGPCFKMADFATDLILASCELVSAQGEWGALRTVHPSPPSMNLRGTNAGQLTLSQWRLMAVDEMHPDWEEVPRQVASNHHQKTQTNCKEPTCLPLNVYKKESHEASILLKFISNDKRCHKWGPAGAISSVMRHLPVFYFFIFMNLDAKLNFLSC